MTDDQGWYELGCHGNRYIDTPVLDRLAAQSVELTRFYASPVCTPTRASLMTGRYYQRTGAVDTYMGRDTLNVTEITLARILHDVGYATGIFGKWHLGRYARYHPLQRGFDQFLGFWQYGFINRYDDSDELWHNHEPIITTGYITDVLTDEAIAWLRGQHDKPFFLYLPYNAPHSPHLVPDLYIKPYLEGKVDLATARIYGMITCIDKNVGRLLQAIEEEKLAERTLLIFMSDNGGVSTFEKLGLRGLKGSCYEGGIRVPFLARFPGRLPAGAKCDAITAHIDLLPTLCEVAGAKLPSDRPIDGRNILPLLEKGSGPSPHEYLFHQWNRVRPDPDKSWAVHHGRYKLVNGELFDLQNDPAESKDLAGAQPELAGEMRAAFMKWFEEVTAGQAYRRVAIEIGRGDENPVEIDLDWGEPHGKAALRQRHYNRDSIEEWSSEKDAVWWNVAVERDGLYEVVLSYGCDDAQAGEALELSLAPPG